MARIWVFTICPHKCRYQKMKIYSTRVRKDALSFQTVISLQHVTCFQINSCSIFLYFNQSFAISNNNGIKSVLFLKAQMVQKVSYCDPSFKHRKPFVCGSSAMYNVISRCSESCTASPVLMSLPRSADSAIEAKKSLLLLTKNFSRSGLSVLYFPLWEALDGFEGKPCRKESLANKPQLYFWLIFLSVLAVHRCWKVLFLTNKSSETQST